MTTDQKKNLAKGLSVASICLGIASIFLWEFSIISILAIIFGIVGLLFNKNKWTPGIGLTLGIIFLLVRISQGHIDRGIPASVISNNNPQAIVTPLRQNNSFPSQQNNTYEVNQPPDKVGQCQETTVAEISTRLDGVAGSGSYIIYADNLQQISYDTIQGIEDSIVGDKVNLCLVSVPTNCPPGDDRGIVYSATNIRTGENWEAQDSEHSCGGA